MTVFQKDVLALIKAALIPNTSVSLHDGFDWNALLALGQAHQIIPLLYYGIKRAGIGAPDAVLARFKSETLSCIVADEKQCHAVNEVLQAFEEHGIDHMPLKGVIIKPLYPASEMRMMGDADILIRETQYEQIRPLLLSLGYEEGVKSPHEYIWIKKGSLFLELHHRTFAPRNKEFVRFYGDGWLKASPCADTSCRFELDDEATLAYLAAHLAKHYRDSGVGLRHMLDIWMFLRAKPAIDQKRLADDLAQLRLDIFYANLLQTFSVWFEDAEPNEVTDLITNRVFASGSYGTQNSKSVVNVTEAIRTQGQLRTARWFYLFDLIFPSYQSMCFKYRWLKRCPVLLPVMWFVRLFDILLFKTKKIKNTKQKFDQMTPELLDAEQRERHAVGLHFAFEDEE